MNIKKRVVEPKDVPQAETEAVELFSRTGWGSDASWLAPLTLEVIAPDGQLETLDDLAERRLQVVASSADHATPLDRDSRLLRAFVSLCDPKGYGDSFYRSVSTDGRNDVVAITPEVRERIAVAFRLSGDPPADFVKALVQTGWPATYDDASKMTFAVSCQTNDRLVLEKHDKPALFATIELLTGAAGVDFTKVVDVGSLMAEAVARWPADFGEPPARVATTFDMHMQRVESPRRFDPWVLALGPAALVPLLASIEPNCDETGFAAIALGVRCAIERWLAIGGHHPTHFHAGAKLLGKAALPWFEALHARAARHGSPECAPLRRAWLWFAQCAFEAFYAPHRSDYDAAHAGQIETVLQAAGEDLATLRKLLVQAKATSTATRSSHDGSQQDAAAQFAAQSEHLGVCVCLLYRFGGIWRGLKPMLLAWRALTTPAVGGDLRYWPERGFDGPPRPWSDLVAWPINLFHHHVPYEQVDDRELTRLRGELAAFCLERLRDRLTHAQRKAGGVPNNGQMVERSPLWRFCLVRALAGLGIDPDGRGHRTLYVCAIRDPDDGVKEAARDAYERMRRSVGLPEDVSPRRAILSTLWWMRQAHLLALGARVDPDGAQRTRIKELTRTKEIERAEARERND